MREQWLVQLLENSHIIFSGHDLESLLFKFLDEFLFLFSAEPFFTPKVNHHIAIYNTRTPLKYGRLYYNQIFPRTTILYPDDVLGPWNTDTSLIIIMVSRFRGVPLQSTAPILWDYMIFQLGDVFTIHVTGRRMTFVAHHGDFKASFFQNGSTSFQAAVQPFTMKAGVCNTIYHLQH